MTLYFYKCHFNTEYTEPTRPYFNLAVEYMRDTKVILKIESVQNNTDFIFFAMEGVLFYICKM